MGPEHRPYLKATGYADEPGWLADELAAANPTPIIVRARAGRSVLSTMSLDARHACVNSSVRGRNLALKILATWECASAEAFLVASFPSLKSVCFVQMFRRKGRLVGVLDHLPVQVILNPLVSLLGAALHGLSRADTLPQSSGVSGA